MRATTSGGAKRAARRAAASGRRAAGRVLPAARKRVRRHASGARIRCALALAVALAAATPVACDRGDGRLDVLLVTVDTLRPDHLGFGGARRPTSPNIDALAARGVVFTRAYSQAGWTLPSIASILTGRYPRDHGATDFHWSLDATLPTLPEILRARGYQTAGFVSHVFLTPTYGIGPGFETFDASVLDVGNPHDVSTARPLTDRVLAWLRRARSPWFVWVHYFDPHFAYLPHAGYEHFGDGDEARYDQEIAFTDYHLGRLLRAVDPKRTLVVFMADHGEEFGEHGGRYHYTLHEEVLRVPLVIAGPGIAPRRVDTPVDQVDLLPTILGVLGVEAPDSLPGRDILAPDLEPHPIFVERDRPPPFRQVGVIDGTDKVFIVERVDPESIPPASRGTAIPVRNVAAGVYRFDLAADPGERRNVHDARDARELALIARLLEHARGARHHLDAPVDVSPELRRRLRSLGYLR